MNKNLIFHDLKHGSQEWLDFRVKEGIGGSEASTILGLNKYKSGLELFHEKVGTREGFFEGNQKTFHGSNLEDYIANIWQYYDGTIEGMIKRHSEGLILRKCRRLNRIVVNPDYPWLFANIDRLINQNQPRLDGGSLGDKEGLLEVKTIGEYAAAMWESGVPPGYVVQCQQYMLILGLEYAEIAILKAGQYFDCFIVERNEAIIARIIEESFDFWYKRVLPAREAFGNFKAGAVSFEEYETVKQKCEPEPDSTEAYKNFMSEKFTREIETMAGSPEHYKHIEDYKKFHFLGGLIDERKELAGNYLRNAHVNNKVEMIGDKEGFGYSKFYKRKGGTNFTLDVRPKDIAGLKSQAEEIFNKLFN